MIKKKDLSFEDKKIWEDYIKNPSDIFDKEKINSLETKKKNCYKFDLHGYTLDEANIKVKEIILSCSEKKYKEILLITGKGIHSQNDKDVYSSKDLGKLKYSVPEYIKSDLELKQIVVSIKNAGVLDGGDGAIIIKLRSL